MTSTLIESSRVASAPLCNPLVEQRADPHIHRHADGMYYMAATAPEYDRIELRRAPTVAGLAAATPRAVWRKRESGPLSAHIWAPELHHIDGKWYLHVAGGEAADPWKIRMHVLENASPDPLKGEWRHAGQIHTAWESFSLDATPFEHRGERYLAWAQHDPAFGGNTCLFLARMDSPWSITGSQVRISEPSLPWERVGYLVNEGPAFLRRNGRVFIAYSASATDHNYCMGLLAADEDADLLDRASWWKSPVPVFASCAASSQFGPGHNSFTVAGDGETDLLVYHARGYLDIEGDPLGNPDRHTRVQPFTWRADGLPDFGEPVPDGELPIR